MIFQNRHYEVNLFISFQLSICQIFFFPFYLGITVSLEAHGFGTVFKRGTAGIRGFATPFQDSSVLHGPGSFLMLIQLHWTCVRIAFTPVQLPWNANIIETLKHLAVAAVVSLSEGWGFPGWMGKPSWMGTSNLLLLFVAIYNSYWFNSVMQKNNNFQARLRPV